MNTDIRTWKSWMVSHTTPAGMKSDEAMSQGFRLRKFLLANVAVNVPKTWGPPTSAVTPRLMAADDMPSHMAMRTAGTMATLATSTTRSNVALFSQGVRVLLPPPWTALGARSGSCCQV